MGDLGLLETRHSIVEWLGRVLSGFGGLGRGGMWQKPKNEIIKTV